MSSDCTRASEGIETKNYEYGQFPCGERLSEELISLKDWPFQATNR